eukprot:13440074-Alexandrium_andersonii.AAC.1
MGHFVCPKLGLEGRERAAKQDGSLERVQEARRQRRRGYTRCPLHERPVLVIGRADTNVGSDRLPM